MVLKSTSERLQQRPFRTDVMREIYKHVTQPFLVRYTPERRVSDTGGTDGDDDEVPVDAERAAMVGDGPSSGRYGHGVGA